MIKIVSRHFIETQNLNKQQWQRKNDPAVTLKH